MAIVASATRDRPRRGRGHRQGSAGRPGHVPAVRHAERRAADPGVPHEHVGRPARGLGQARQREPADRGPRRSRRTRPPPLAFAGKDTGNDQDRERPRPRPSCSRPRRRCRSAARSCAWSRRRRARSQRRVKDELDVPFLPAGPEGARRSRRSRSTPGTLDLVAKATALKNWVPTSETTTFWLTANPYGESFEHLELPDPLSVRLHRADDVVDAAAAVRREPRRAGRSASSPS